MGLKQDDVEVDEVERDDNDLMLQIDDVDEYENVVVCLESCAGIHDDEVEVICDISLVDDVDDDEVEVLEKQQLLQLLITDDDEVDEQ